MQFALNEDQIAVRDMAREIAAGGQLQASGTPPARIPAERIRAMADKNPKRDGEGPIDTDLWVKALTSD